MGKSRKSLGRRFAHKGGAIAFRLARLLFVRKDPIASERVGRRLGRIIQVLASKQRKRCRSNLRLVFSDLSEPEVRQLASRCFEHFGVVMSDFIRADVRSFDEVAASVVEVEGVEFAESALAMGKGVLSMTGHFGNWERAAAWTHSRGHSLTVVQRDANDEVLNDIVSDLRRASGVEVLSRNAAGRGILRALGEGKLVGILADQNADEAFIEMFGLPTGTVLGPAQLSQKSGAPMLPTYCVRIGPNKYKVIFYPPICPQERGLECATAAMQTLSRSLEEVVRRYPEQWLWFHDRWKSARRRGLVPGQ